MWLLLVDVPRLVVNARYGVPMRDDLIPERFRPGPPRRHQARVERFSADAALLDRLDRLAVSDEEALFIVEAACSDASVPPPRLRFHARRSPYTGATEHPRWWLAEYHGEAWVVSIEQQSGKALPQDGAIRLGRTTTLMTVAHELGHHFVFALDPVSTPAHGKKWVARFDQAADAIRSMLPLPALKKRWYLN